MAKPYQLVVFDWEGTLGEDTLSLLILTLVRVAERMHLGAVDLKMARQHIHNGLVVVIHKLFPQASPQQREDVLLAVQKDAAATSGKAHIMPGAWEVVQWLHDSGVHLGIATNKSYSSLMHVLVQSGLNIYFKVVRTASQAPPKPCPQMLEEIMATFAVEAGRTLMIGDSTNDMLMARSLRVDAVGMDFFQVEEALLRRAGAGQVFADYQQLLNYLKEAET